MTLKLKTWQQFHIWRAGRLQTVTLALATRTFVKHIARASRIEGESLSKCGSRLSAARIRFQKLQEFTGLTAGRFQNVALALAPR
eukprot:4589516-Pyramimonas_sp.AAC.1